MRAEVAQPQKREQKKTPAMPLEPVQLILGSAAALLLLAVIVLLTRLSAARQHLTDLREEARETAGLREALAVARAEADRLPRADEELRETRTRLHEEVSARAQAESALKTLQREHEARLEELRGMKKDLEDRFANLASGVLQKNSESFLDLVSERFKSHSQTAQADLDKRNQAIENLVKPLHEKLGHFDSHIKQIEKARNEAYGEIRQQVAHMAKGQETLGSETRKLVQALRAPKTRGRWGEMQLRQVFDMAGMSENVDYRLEQHMDTDAGARRPDAIVHIPGGKSIVVDAKTPLEAYLDALEAETPEEQTTHIARHAAQVKKHVQLLASKAYQDGIDETPDFVVMFIPGETFVSAAAEADPGVIEYAFERKVLIATPTTLMALVKAIAYGWQQEKMAKNAAEVQKSARELYDRLKVFGGHLDAIGKALGRSVDCYNKAVGSMETRVLPSARKFEAMGVIAPGGEAESPRLIDGDPRRLSVLGEDV